MIRHLSPLAALMLTSSVWAAGFSPLDRTTARSLVDAQSHRQPTIVALWSSDCIHCKKNLGLFAAMAKTERRLKVVTVATEPESAALAPMLEKTGIQGERFAYGSDNPEAIAYALDPAWGGELPRTLIFDGRGGKTALSGVIDEQKLRAVLGTSVNKTPLR